MAVILGTNAGFVTVAPTNDPSGTTTVIDNGAVAIKDTAPVGSGKITEIGWWCDNATEETNFEVGLYAHDSGNNKPGARLYVSNTNAKGTGAGWKTAAVNWTITAETIYWIAIQVDNTVTATNIDRNTDATRISIITSTGGLANPWGTSTETTWCRAVYAVWEVGITYSELSGTCVGVGIGSGDLELNIYSDLSGTCVGVGIGSGDLELNIYSDLSGTCVGVGSGSGDLGSVLVNISSTITYKRLVVIGNDEVWFEDI